jgi:hypothetical protein
MRQLMERIIELEDKLEPYDTTLDVLASLKLPQLQSPRHRRTDCR